MDSDVTHEGRNSDRGESRISVIVRQGMDTVRQWAQPGPFRIEVPLQADVASDCTPESPSLFARGPQSGRANTEMHQVLQTLATVATALWRVQAKVPADLKSELPAEFRHLPRHIQAAWDALAAGHIEVQDPTGQRYVPGMAVNPITFQPMEGIGSEMIHETLKPSIFYKDNLIQRADVIIARPLEPQEMVPSPVAPAAKASSPDSAIGPRSSDVTADNH